MCYAKNTKISIDNKEINETKMKINDLSSTLSKYIINKNRLESSCQKNQIPKKTTCCSLCLLLYIFGLFLLLLLLQGRMWLKQT